MTPARLSRRWLTAAIPPPSGATRLISAFLREELVDWTAFTFDDAQDALAYLVHYAVVDWVYDDLDDDDGPPNQGNPWHALLHVYDMTDALMTMPGVCPDDIPFY
jgi:hypothetical protein